VPGIHVLKHKESQRRGWPGQARPWRGGWVRAWCRKVGTGFRI